jgi:uncharacterized protein YbcI
LSLRDVESTPHQHGDLLTAISKGMVALLKEFYGRGPTRAKELMRERFVAVIEEMTGQRVIGFMSGNQQDPDIMCEVFILDPTDLVDEHEIPDGGPPTPRERREARKLANCGDGLTQRRLFVWNAE